MRLRSVRVHVCVNVHVTMRARVCDFLAHTCERALGLSASAHAPPVYIECAECASGPCLLSTHAPPVYIERAECASGPCPLSTHAPLVYCERAERASGSCPLSMHAPGIALAHVRNCKQDQAFFDHQIITHNLIQISKSNR